MRQLITAFITIAALGMALLSCSLETRTYSYDNKYSLVLAPGMKQVNGINDQSDYQFLDSAKNITLFVIRDGKRLYDSLSAGSDLTGLDGYATVAVQILNDQCETLDIRDVADTTIHDMKAKYVAMNLVMGKTEQTYIALCAYEGDSCYYQVYSMCEALSSAYHVHDMARMVQSLKEN